jgi:putative membrane protein
MLAGLVGAVGMRWLAWHRTGFVLDKDRLLIRTGWWRRRTLILPIRRIQSIDLTSNFINRRFGTASLAFGVAGGSGFSAHQIPALDEERARELRKQLLTRLL